VKSVYLIIALTLIVAGCGQKDDQQQAAQPAAESTTAAHADAPQDGLWRGTVTETINSGGYTYVLLDMGGEARWVAGPQTTVTAGEKVIMAPGMEMKNFTSNTMDRTFDSIWFVGAIEPDDGHTHAAAPAAGDHPAPTTGDHPAPTATGGGMPGMGADASSHTTLADAGVQGVEKLAGGHTVAELFGQSASLAGNPVKVRGRVVKFTANIMGTNWIHLQDGTGSAGTHDLTVTTAAKVQVGDMVVVEGPLSVDRDFGAGYRYAVIIENATVTTE